MPWQVTGYLPQEEAQTFRDYAVGFNLDKSALASLLIVRELSQHRLQQLLDYRHQVPRSLCIKVTAHLHDRQLKLAFMEASQQVGLKAAAAAEILFRAELAEHWLERCVTSRKL